MTANFLGEIRNLVSDISIREGCYLYDIEFVGAHAGRTLRVFIDKETEGGASIDDCSKITRGLNEVLDANEELIPGGEYQLEVSTPGLERVLKEPRHYDQSMGKKISVKTFAPLLDFNPEITELGKAKQVQGPLLSYDDAALKVGLVETGGVQHLNDGEAPKEVRIPFDTITKAHVVFEFAEPEKPGKPGKGVGHGKKSGKGSSKK